MNAIVPCGINEIPSFYAEASRFARRWLAGEEGLGAEPLAELFQLAMLKAFAEGMKESRCIPNPASQPEHNTKR